MRRLTLLIVLALASRSDLLGAQGPPPDDGLSGHYRGFAQSALNAELRMPMALLVDRSDGPEFFGSLTLGPIPFAFQGKIDAAGHFKGRGTGAAGDVSFIGTAQGFGDGGVLARATYKFAPASGARADQGVADFIRSPHQPPDPVIPLGGVCEGSVAYGTGMGDGKVSIEGIQDGTSPTGRFVLDPGTAKALSWEIVGGIQPCVLGGTARCTHRIVLIGAGPAGRLVASGEWVPPPDDGSPPPDDSLNMVAFFEFLGGGVELATIAVRR